MKLAVIGMGRMGRALAQRLLATGHEVAVWNRTPGRAPEVVAQGAREAPTLADAVGAAEVVMLSLADDQAVLEVVTGDDELLGALAMGAVVVDASTVSPGTTARLAEAVGPSWFVAMPILGSPMATASGEAMLLFGGEPAVVDRLSPLWEALAPKRRYCGAAPLASVLKLASNLVLVAGVAALAEAVGMAEAGGVDTAALRDFLEDSPLVAPGLRNRLEDVLSGDHTGWWTTELAAKDVRLAAEVAEAGGRWLPVTRAAEGLCERAAATGWAGADLGAVAEVVRGTTGAVEAPSNPGDGVGHLPVAAEGGVTGEEDSELLGSMPFSVALGVELLAAAPEEVTGRLAWDPQRCTAGGVLHGGAIMGLADSLGGLCAFLNLPEGATTSTIESKTNFFRPVRGGHAHATSRPLHRGRAVVVVQTDVVDDDGHRVAQVTQTQAVLEPQGR
ncbi:MAG TPA: NAD(P)-binding domain-containing protein [Acidimicrobiales bacterium]|nr:NAD(P)-binding domain-containing protein [Acidimicrobiales bacterium]